MKDLLTRNLGLKLVSLIAAFFVWLSVASEPELATIVSVPVEYRNYPKNLDISSDIASTIRVEARGPARQLKTLTDSGVAAVVDFSSVQEPGERTFTLTAADLNLPRGIDLMRTVPAQLRFRFENRTTNKVVVAVPFSGSLPPGFTILVKTVDPPELEIEGPESRVRKAAQLTSDPFDLSRVAGDTTETLSVYAPDAELRILGTPRVKVNIRVQRVP
ncbi:MAG TPA: CdaR family protein [Bryobacteraceae bacterium]|jgi:YbbR domain-containing protein|nr:CdaR family protein [Bryobacteraceae bacterium]